MDDLFTDYVPQEATSTKHRAVMPAAAPPQASLLDDLIGDLVPPEVTSARHRVAMQGPGLSTPPCLSMPPCSDVARPVGREFIAESSLFDQLFKDMEADAKGDIVEESSTVASDDEIPESKMHRKESLLYAAAPLVAAVSPRVAAVSAHREQVDACIWESFGAW